MEGAGNGDGGGGASAVVPAAFLCVDVGLFIMPQEDLFVSICTVNQCSISYE